VRAQVAFGEPHVDQKKIRKTILDQNFVATLITTGVWAVVCEVAVIISAT